MNLLAPGFLALGALALPLIALYILKLRRREVTVSSTLLWEQAVRDLQANTPFQRLRSNLLLLLQLLLLALLVFALARPALRRTASPGKVVVLVIDTSASMGALHDGRTRLDLARESARAVLEQLGETDEAMLVEAWSGARVVTGLSRDRSEALRALDALAVRDTATASGEALRLAATIVEKREGARIMLFSDGASVDVPSHPVLESSLTWMKAGGPAGNMGITAFRAEIVTSPDGRIETREEGGVVRVPCSVFAAVSNFTGAKRKTYVTLRAAGEFVAVRAVEPAPGATEGVSFEAALPAGKDLDVSIDDGGALAADDRAWARVPEPVELRVQVAGDQKFVRALLSTRPGLVAVESAPDLWFGEGDAVSPPAGTNVVWFAPGRAVAGIVPGDAVERVRALSWDETHDLLRFARFGDVHVARASRLVLAPEVENLVQGSAGPLIALARERGTFTAVVAFRPGESDWPLRPSFPIFLSNVLRTAASSRASVVPLQIAAGTPAVFGAAAGATAVVTPKGTRIPLVASSTGDAVFAGTDTAGRYTCETASGPRTFGVNLLSEAEANLEPPQALGTPDRPVVPTDPAGSETRDIWPWIAAAALLFFVVEWACFHRRLA